MRWLQLPCIGLLAILAVIGCKKVVPETIITQSNMTVTTVAGSGGKFGNYIDGIGKLAAFNNMTSIVRDPAGNLYVSDQNNFRIRKITPSGVVTTFAGSGVNGYLDGTGTAAQFGYLESLVIDASGNLYVSDNGNNVIRKITPAGVVTTYAGNGNSGLVNGPVATAEFSAPAGLAIDKSGSLYVGDSGNYLIRKITADGTVSNYAGTPGVFNNRSSRYTGPADHAVFGFIIPGITVDASGNVYATDQLNNFIYKITPTGNASTWAGDGAKGTFEVPPFQDGLTITAEFANPYAITADAVGNIYIADAYNQRIRKITPDLRVTTMIGNGEPGQVDGTPAEARVLYPYGIVTSADGNLIYFTEKNRVVKIENVTTTTKPQNDWNNPQTWGNSH